MPYLNLDLDYFDHPKTRRLIGLLGKGSAELPIRLWIYCGKFHARNGVLDGYSAQEIEALVGWWGKQGQMVEAMTRTGFLETDGGTYRVHDWKEHAGHLIEFKKRAQVAAFARWDKIGKKKGGKHSDEENASGMLGACLEQSPMLTMPSAPAKKDLAASPPRQDSPFQKFMNAYLKQFEDMDIRDPDELKRKAAGQAYKRFCRPGKAVFDMALGDPDKALAGVRAIGLWLQNQGMTWTLDTTVKWFPTWMRNPEELSGKSTNRSR